MTEQELKRLSGIIAALKDIEDSVRRGWRNRAFAVEDIWEESNNLKDLAVDLDEVVE